MGITVFVSNYFMASAFRFGQKANTFLSILVALIIPAGYLGYTGFVIWRRDLMPSASGRMKELAWYFFRIILFFLLMWIPGLLLIIVGAFYVGGDGNVINFGYLFCALQPILSTSVAMTKSDVRQYVANLLTL